MRLDPDVAAFFFVGTLGVGFIGFILRWAWTQTHAGIQEVKAHADKRVDDMTAYVGRELVTLSELIERKADNAELNRARDAQVNIFDQLRQHELEDRNQHGTVLTAIGRLEGKMDALLARKRQGE